jgi:hypothetical protein
MPLNHKLSLYSVSHASKTIIDPWPSPRRLIQIAIKSISQCENVFRCVHCSKIRQKQVWATGLLKTSEPFPALAEIAHADLVDVWKWNILATGALMLIRTEVNWWNIAQIAICESIMGDSCSSTDWCHSFDQHVDQLTWSRDRTRGQSYISGISMRNGDCDSLMELGMCTRGIEGTDTVSRNSSNLMKSSNSQNQSARHAQVVKSFWKGHEPRRNQRSREVERSIGEKRALFCR